MTTLMHQSEITIDPYVHEYTDPHEIMAYQTCKIPDWDGSSQTSWSVARSIEHDILESKAPSSSDSAKQQRRCDKLCRNVLLTFLILSVVTAVVAAIGLSVFLTLHDNGFAKDKGHHHGNHIHPNITTEEEMYLSKIFCSLVKILLRNTDFPVETGLENCHTVLL
ncbi:uncharacterized protein LOC123556015 [Mercenaria mercenaria]|uniref:uncharacterized protein LOC123556015 n=1 Tax=Mercenaria mercenaria TaxID=6596 RepID=UPI00234E6C04|nr:uncharacterized protein LOC123556015 [Mercenaria mercenaria]